MDVPANETLVVVVEEVNASQPPGSAYLPRVGAGELEEAHRGERNPANLAQQAVAYFAFWVAYRLVDILGS